MTFGLYFGLLFITLSGPVLASFFTATTQRTANLTKANGHRSECDHCGHSLRWFELIPIVSFLLVRGKCRYCGKPISIKLFMTEVVGLFMYAALALAFWHMVSDQGGINLAVILATAIGYVFLSTLAYLAIYDLFTYSLPTNVTVLLLGEALIANGAILVVRLLSPGSFSSIHLGNLDNLALGIVGYALFYVIIKVSKQKAMGVGDMYLACACGLMLGWPLSISWFYVMLFSATGVGLLLALMKKRMKNLLLPLVPFMTFGYVVASVWGDRLFQLLFPRI